MKKQLLHHDVHSGKLRPHLKSTTKEDTTRVATLEQVKIRPRAFSTFKSDLMYIIRREKERQDDGHKLVA